jgi:tetratricopeptide (TPR) repeat protein
MTLHHEEFSMSEYEPVDRFVLAGKFRSLLQQHERAIEIYDEAIERFPDDPRLYRLRGHRYLNVREFQKGQTDLQRAADLIEGRQDEFDYFSKETASDIENVLLGRPILDQHREVTPRSVVDTESMFKSTLHFSVYYHLALAYFLLEEYDQALSYYMRCDEVCIDDDARTAVSDWTYMTLQRLGRGKEARALLDAIDTGSFRVNEDTPLYVNRLRLYKGELTPESLRELATTKPLAMVTAEFAIGQWHLAAGRDAAALESFDRILSEGDRHSFAYLVTERDRDGLVNT